MTGPLRVAHVVATVGATGVEAHLITLLSSFDRSEVEPVLFVPGPGILVDRARSRGISIEFGAPVRKLDLKAVRTLSSRWAGDFDVVHAHGARASFWALRAARKARIGNFVVTLHELRWQVLRPGLKRGIWTALEDRVWTEADGIICVSRAVSNEVLGRLPELEGKSWVVPASTPMLLEADRLPRAEPGREDDGTLRLATVGRFSWEKGYDLLFPALADLDRAGVAFSLDVVGFGILEPELRALASRLGLDRRIRWWGGKADIPRLLSTAHAFVTATRGETFGIATLEAMAIGLPVLVPAVGGLPELVDDAATGALVPFAPEETLPARLAAILVRWARDPEERARLGDRAARRARDAFSPSQFARGVTEVYRSLVAKHGRHI